MEPFMAWRGCLAGCGHFPVCWGCWPDTWCPRDSRCLEAGISPQGRLSCCGELPVAGSMDFTSSTGQGLSNSLSAGIIGARDELQSPHPCHSLCPP